jgi:hypothetical protein
MLASVHPLTDLAEQIEVCLFGGLERVSLEVGD